MNILLDMDGVLVDFVRSAHEYHELPFNGSYGETYGFGEWDFVSKLPMVAKDFWGSLGYEFWKECHPMPDAEKILDIVTRYGEPYVLTSPAWTRGCIEGKIAWMRRHCPSLAGRMIFTKYKHLMARADNLLIDDYDNNVDGFYESGGKVVLVPREWNSLHGIDTLEHLNNCMEAYYAKAINTM